jgi:hypothetical protein
METSKSQLFQKLQEGSMSNPNMVKDDDPTLKALVSGLSLDDAANRAVLSDRMEELGRTAEAKLLRSQHPVRYNHNAPGVGPVLTAGEYIEPAEEDAESGLQVFWGEILLGTIEATQRKGVPATSHHWHKKQGETDQFWFRRVLQLDLNEQETVRVQFLLGLACHDLLKAMQDDEDA